MKKLFMVLPLVFLLCVFLIESRPVQAEEWTAEQKAAADCFHKYIDAAVKGDIEKMKSFYHPQMSWWDYKQEHPVGIDIFLKGQEDFYKSGVEWVSCDAKPIEIHVVDNVAILYATWKNIYKDAEGNETTPSGVWTAVLIKQDDKWLFLSNSYIQTLAQERQAIAEANIKLGEAVRLGDASALANLYTEDAWLMNPEGDLFKGREGIEAFWVGAFQTGMKEAVLTTMDVMKMDDMVGEFGKADLTIKPEGQDEIKAVAKYLVIWKKAADGTWKLYADIMF